MASRDEFHDVLELVLGSKNVYNSPPPTIEMKYPCIVYQRSKILSKFADNRPYSQKIRYKVTVIDKNPDSLVPLKISLLPFCTHDTNFVVNNLIHDVYSIYI